ncbi:MAG: isoprenyl transferase [Rikenellaceae bacterium]
MKLDIKTRPKHVAIIMDGNGRWAQERGLERAEGHIRGVDSFRTAVDSALDIGVEFLTVYAFSKENWARPKEEVDGLMSLFCKVISLEIPNLNEKGVRVLFLYEKNELSNEVLESLENCVEQTKNNTVLTIVVALNYGSRSEIVNATKEIAQKVKQGELSVDQITETLISDHLLTKGIPDPDLVIRTSGECRISNFLLWQISYSELIFVKKYWPDFNKEDFFEAVKEYSMRKRRFGKL